MWRRTARPDQVLPEGDWRVCYYQGGRGSGKTTSGANGLAEIIQDDTDPDGQFGIVAPTYRDAWTVCVEGESGLLRALGTSAGQVKDGTSQVVAYAHRSYGEIGLKTGQVIYVDSADDGALRVQGKNLRALWADEVGLFARWETAWNESIKYAVRRGVSKIIATGTPKASRPARKLIRSLIRNEPEHGGVVVRRLRTIDNIANLSEAFYRTVIGTAKGTRLERQELEGELLDDVANALWTRELLDACQAPWIGEPGGPSHLTRIYIGVDPSDGNEDSDEQAFCVVARGAVDDPHVYVLESWGGQEAPAMFARRVIKKAQEFYPGTCPVTLVLEKNHGGGWLKATFEQVMKDAGRVPYEVVHASQAKRTRAEPVSALYERGIVKHCQRTVSYKMADGITHHDTTRFTELEDQMATFTGAQGERSPDRLDSLVWGCHFFLDASYGPLQPALRAEWAAKKDLDTEWGPDPAEPAAGQTRAQRRLAEAHGDAYRGDWSDAGFAPQDDPQPQEEAAARGRVFGWR